MQSPGTRTAEEETAFSWLDDFISRRHNPFAGFFKNLSRETQIILHTSVVRGFMENAKKMVSEKGEIHITHKTNGFHSEWKLEVVASLLGLKLVEAVDFSNLDYHGYNTKRGFGGDDNFDCNPSKTYKFRLF